MHTDQVAGKPTRGPIDWLRAQRLTREYWIFFSVALFFDAGFAIYFFLFNLFLLDTHTTDRAIGLINGAFTLGSTLATLPAGMLGRRFGVKGPLIFCLITAPLLGALRVFAPGTAAQIILSFFAGASMCLWAVSYLPAVARLTDESNRASAYSLIFSASIITSAIGGAATTYLPTWLQHASRSFTLLKSHQCILIASCVVAIVAVWPAAYLHLSSNDELDAVGSNLFTGFRPTPFLIRFLPFMALWTATMGAFLPFANVFLVRQQFVSVQNVGLVYSAGQCLQLFLGLLTPIVLRFFGLVRGIFLIQLVAVAGLASLALNHSATVAIIFYLLFSTAHWMSSPALYNLLMSRVADAQRSHAAAMAFFLNTLLSSLTVTLAGAAFTRFNFPISMLTIAATGAAVAGGLYWSISTFRHVEHS